jgi:hypothetical protein
VRIASRSALAYWNRSTYGRRRASSKFTAEPRARARPPRSPLRHEPRLDRAAERVEHELAARLVAVARLERDRHREHGCGVTRVTQPGLAVAHGGIVTLTSTLPLAS